MNITYGQRLGQRERQEDRFFVLEDRSTDHTLLAVFDGHSGDKTVNTLVENVLTSYKKSPDLKDIFKNLNEMTQSFEDGSTGSIVLIDKDTVTLGVLGDSPIQVLMKDGSTYVMPEHNIRTNAREYKEALERGGVTYNGYLFDLNRPGGFNKGLQMSRAFGDVYLDKVLNRTPEIAILQREDVHSVLVASDGLTDPAHMSSPFLLTKDVRTEELLETYKNSFDNVTVIIAHLEES